MRFMKYTSLLCLVSICALDNAFADNPPAPRPVYMTSQIQRLLNEKQEKISKLEECDGKRKGFMIAGISTIGLTAVGVGVNIAQANKSNKLSNQIADQNRELEKQQSNLANINSQISEIQSNNARRECESKAGMIFVNGQCLDKQQYERSIAPQQNNNDNNNPNGQQNNAPVGSALQYDGVIGEQCQDGATWTKDDAGDKKCVASKDATETMACKCVGQGVRSPVQTNPDNSNPGNTAPNYASWRVTCDTYKFTFPAGPRVTEDERRLMDQCISEMKGRWTLLPGENPEVSEWICENMKKCSETPPKVEPIKLEPKKLDSIPVTEPELAPLPLRDNSENPNRPPKVEPITLQPKGPGLLPTKPIEPNFVPLQRSATITGLCLNEEGDQAKGDGDFCWCHIDMPDYCRKDITTPIKGVCNGDTNARNDACTKSCRSKEKEFRDYCDALQ